MQRFSTQSKLNVAYMTWEDIFKHFTFHFQIQIWQMSLWPHMINKLAIQPQIKHNQVTKTCQDHIKAFTHERAYT
jgi:hypothetical protein